MDPGLLGVSWYGFPLSARYRTVPHLDGSRFRCIPDLIQIEDWRHTITGWWFQPLWTIWKSVGMMIPIYGKTCSKPPTRLFMRPLQVAYKAPSASKQALASAFEAVPTLVFSVLDCAAWSHKIKLFKLEIYLSISSWQTDWKVYTQVLLKWNFTRNNWI